MKPRRTSLTHPDRVLFPDDGITKGDLAEYYRHMASRLLPHVADRPLSLVRCPDGIGKGCFYQKHWSGSLPNGVASIRIKQADGRRLPYLIVSSASGLAALVQHGVIELHPWGARADDLERPDRIVFDLDPGPGVAWAAVRAAARTLRTQLRSDGMRSWVKSTGGKGLHIVVPVGRGPLWDEVHDFARDTAERLAEAAPGKYLATARKSARRGRIFIDWLRNVRGATSVAPWSVRARARAPVSVPWSWDRLGALRSASQVTVRSAARVARGTDPWAALGRCRQGISAPKAAGP